MGKSRRVVCWREGPAEAGPSFDALPCLVPFNQVADHCLLAEVPNPPLARYPLGLDSHELRCRRVEAVRCSSKRHPDPLPRAGVEFTGQKSLVRQDQGLLDSVVPECDNEEAECMPRDVDLGHWLVAEPIAVPAVPALAGPDRFLDDAPPPDLGPESELCPLIG